jgi:hypothetical protein
MSFPLQVTFRNMGHFDSFEALVRQQAAKLDSFAEHILSCRAVTEPVGKHHRRGNLYRVRLDLTVPDARISVTRGPGGRLEHRDARIALRDAFEAARRRLGEYVRRRQGFVKAHALRGEVRSSFGPGRVTAADRAG